MKAYLSALKGRALRLTSILKYRQKFSYLSSDSTYPLIEPLCTFENASSIYMGRDVKFLKGCCVLANEGRIEIGHNSTICRFTIVQSVGGKVSIGNNTTIGDFCNLYGQGGLEIGNNVMIASCVQIVPNQHTFDEPELPICEQPNIAFGVRIDNDCWIGTNVVILDGVTIGRGAVVGAGSVVTRNVPAYSITVGIPSKVLRFRPGHTASDVSMTI